MTVSSSTSTFGTQPWLAIKTRSGEYLHDNFDIDIPFHAWQYVFDETTLPLDAIETIGVAANNAYGVSSIVRLNVQTNDLSRTVWHQAGNGE